MVVLGEPGCHGGRMKTQIWPLSLTFDTPVLEQLSNLYVMRLVGRVEFSISDRIILSLALIIILPMSW